jgi:hypothetical protein
MNTRYPEPADFNITGERAGQAECSINHQRHVPAEFTWSGNAQPCLIHPRPPVGRRGDP